MGSNRKLIFGAVLVIAGLAFWGLMSALNRVNRVAVAPTPLPAAQQVALRNNGRQIAYATADIPQGTLVTKSMFAMRPMQGNGPTAAFITDPDSQALGYVTSTRIYKGAQIRPGVDFAGHVSQVGVAGMLQPGMRAIVIPFANKPTLHDLVAIGNRVDINAAFDGQESRTIVPNVRVLAVDVFGSDYPPISIAPRGAFKASAPGNAPAPASDASGAPGATPTPTAAPAPGAGRPDPAITLEVTPEQANRILLTQASGGVLDFVVLPTRDAILVDNPVPGTSVSGMPVGEGIALAVSAVTKPQLAPYAERKKAAGGASGASSTRVASSGATSRNGGGSGSNGGAPPRRFTRQDIPGLGGSNPGTSSSPVPFPPGDSGMTSPAPPVESPTYNIPIYADGRTVRVETVPRPQE